MTPEADDLVRRLRADATEAVRIAHHIDDDEMQDTRTVALIHQDPRWQAAARIEALEKLISDAIPYRKAMEAMVATAETRLALVEKALGPFAEIGSWMFARPEVPDSEPVVSIHGINGSGWQLTRGMFKQAHLATISKDPTK
jgi:hypothetical protein